MAKKKALKMSSIVIGAVIILTLAVYLPLTLAANSSENASTTEETSVNEAVDDDGPGDIEDADEQGDIDGPGDIEDEDEVDDDGPGNIDDDDEPGDIDGPGDVEDVD